MHMAMALSIGVALQALSAVPAREAGTAGVPLVQVQTGMDFAEDAFGRCMASCSGTVPADPSAPPHTLESLPSWDQQRYDQCIMTCHGILAAQREFMICIEMAERAHPHSPHWQPEDQQAAQERMEAALERCRQQYQHARP